MNWRILALSAWAALLSGLLLGALFAPTPAGDWTGNLALRDMMVVKHPALSPAALGFGDLPARNAPQDGLLALAGYVIPAPWVARALMLLGAATAVFGAVQLSATRGAARLDTGRGAARLDTGRGTARLDTGRGTARLDTGRGAEPPSLWGQLAAVTVVLWNPFVVERLLQGQWSLVIGAWTLPLIAAAGLRGRLLTMWGGMWLASLTPTGAIFALITAVCCGGARLRTCAVWLITAAPWLVPGVLSTATSHPHGAWAFAPRAETGAGTLGTLLGLGGIWNADAVPPSHQQGFALVGVVLFALLATQARRVPNALLWLAGLGCGGAIVAWLAPDVTGIIIEHVPGAGLLRDSSKLVALALPAAAACAGACRPRWAAAAVALALLHVPDAPVALQQLRPIDIPVVAREARDVFIPDVPTLTQVGPRVVVNPLAKQLSLVENGELRVDGRLVDHPSPRFLAATEAWEAGDLAELRRLGVGVVYAQGEAISTGADPLPRWPGLLLLSGWLLVPVGLAALGRRRAA